MRRRPSFSRAHECARLARMTADNGRLSCDDFARPVAASFSHGGRRVGAMIGARWMLVARWLHKGGRYTAGSRMHGRATCAIVAQDFQRQLARPVARHGRWPTGHGAICCATIGARWRMGRRSMRGRVRGLAPRTKFVVAAAGRPPLRRSSGYIVTAEFF
ncbi:hypothetical protein F511_20994 [Dorcoceras hygrometricum]|uniref:Uncharacterized protein n=1 Tax=Dorcoceras hygrometricum TaxID=472368 RepID=A0A2Z7CUR5_9LAMI|nr:hypothetical protein F511_20994 [Dorcoceras hygrometricum]